MDRGGITIKKTWHASSKKENEDLSNMVGRWDVNVNVSISNPYVYTKGPIQTIKY